MTALTITVNGESWALEPGTTVAALVTEMGCGPAGIAVAVGRTLVPRSAWGDHQLAAGDEVEVLTAAQGG